jgi:hypothetical protein
LCRDVRQAIAGCTALTSAFGPLRHHLRVGRLQPFAYAWTSSTLQFQAEMDLFLCAMLLLQNRPLPGRCWSKATTCPPVRISGARPESWNQPALREGGESGNRECPLRAPRLAVRRSGLNLFDRSPKSCRVLLDIGRHLKTDGSPLDQLTIEAIFDDANLLANRRLRRPHSHFDDGPQPPAQADS